MNKAPLAHSWATDFLDIEHESVRAFTAAAVGGDAGTDRDKAKRLFAAVRDQIRYDPPYTVSDDPAHYRASFVLETGRAYCVPKAVLLTRCAVRQGFRRYWGLPTSEIICRPKRCERSWAAQTCSSITATAISTSTAGG